MRRLAPTLSFLQFSIIWPREGDGHNYFGLCLSGDNAAAAAAAAAEEED
jgi:hypothetical protein